MTETNKLDTQKIDNNNRIQFAGKQLIPVAVELYKNDIKVRFKAGEQPDTIDSQRGNITELSYKSLRRLAFVASNTETDFRSILTLTYPAAYPSDGKAVKRQLNRFLTALRDRFYQPAYLWFMEFQKRGAPHFHILLSVELSAADDLQWASATWYKIVDSGDRKHLAAGTNWQRVRKQDGAKRYAVKYAMKTTQKTVPAEYGNVGRFWGTSKGVAPQVKDTIVLSNRSDTEVRRLLDGWHYLDSCKPETAIRYNAAGVVRHNLDKFFAE